MFIAQSCPGLFVGEVSHSSVVLLPVLGDESSLWPLPKCYPSSASGSGDVTVNFLLSPWHPRGVLSCRNGS